MNTVQPILNRSVTIEFYINDDKKIHMVFNGTRYTFSDFWQKVPEAEAICIYILQQFKFQFPEKYNAANANSKGWKETFIKVVNNHMRLEDQQLDVFIRTSGDVIFHLEL